MGAESNSPAPANSTTSEKEFEWLLCLAAAWQGRQRQEPVQADEERYTRPRFLNAVARVWAFRPRWHPALRRLRAWRKRGAQERDAA